MLHQLLLFIFTIMVFVLSILKLNINQLCCKAGVYKVMQDCVSDFFLVHNIERQHRNVKLCFKMFCLW